MLFLGEIHGIAEVPRLITTLLPELFARGYRGLGMEISGDYREEMEAWALKPELPVHRFFTQPPGSDGRGNVQALAMLRAAAQAGLRLLCFDLQDGEWDCDWKGRDAEMARKLREQQVRLCAGGKVLALCGNMHSRLKNTYAPEHPSHNFWPACAAVLQSMDPAISVRSVNLDFHEGKFYNGSERDLGSRPIEAPYITPDDDLGHTLTLHLPHGTVPTFLEPTGTTAPSS